VQIDQNIELISGKILRILIPFPAKKECPIQVFFSNFPHAYHISSLRRGIGHHPAT
jgi:hypothetical protein